MTDLTVTYMPIEIGTCVCIDDLKQEGRVSKMFARGGTETTVFALADSAVVDLFDGKFAACPIEQLVPFGMA